MQHTQNFNSGFCRISMGLKFQKSSSLHLRNVCNGTAQVHLSSGLPESGCISSSAQKHYCLLTGDISSQNYGHWRQPAVHKRPEKHAWTVVYCPASCLGTCHAMLLTRVVTHQWLRWTSDGPLAPEFQSTMKISSALLKKTQLDSESGSGLKDKEQATDQDTIKGQDVSINGGNAH